MKTLFESFRDCLSLRYGHVCWCAALSVTLLGPAIAAHAASEWTPPVTVGTAPPPAFVLKSPVVAINSSGAQVAAWVSQNNDLLLQVETQDAGGSWSAAQTLSPTKSGVEAGQPSVAISPIGNAVAMWDIFSAGSLLVQASARSAGGSWSKVVTLTSSANPSTVPLVGMDASGNAVAIWLQSSSSGSAIVTANLPVSGSWTTPIVISTPGLTATNPTLAVNSSGDAIAGWQTTDGQILVSERKAGVWGAPTTIAPAAYRQGNPHVALNDEGDEAVAFTGTEVVGGNQRHGTALVATRDAGSAWSAPLIVSNQASSSSARIALDNSGNAVMTFFEAGLLNGNPLEALARAAGGSWSAPILVSSPTDFASSPNLVATPAGTFVAGWMSGETAFAAIRPIGQTAFGTPAVLSSADGPLVLDAATGHAAGIWLVGAQVRVSDAVTP